MGEPPEVHSEPFHTSKMKRFTKIVNAFKPLTNFAMRFILDIWQDSGYASDYKISFL